jgi:hypothetical protein
MSPAPFVAQARGLVRDAMANLVKTGVWAGAASIVAPAKSAGEAEQIVSEAAIE